MDKKSQSVMQISVSFTYCHADLGDDISEMTKRYGNRIDPKDPSQDSNNQVAVFSKPPYFIVASFENGTVALETVRKLDKSSFSDLQIGELLKNNSTTDQVWKGPILLSQSKRWERSDGALASYVFGDHPFMSIRLPNKS